MAQPMGTDEQLDGQMSRFRLEAEEARFLSGNQGGESIRRIAEASRTVIQVPSREPGEDIEYIDMFGDALSRMRAEKYVDFVINQMDGIFRVEDKDLNNDCSIVEVPDECVGFVTGRHGSFLRQQEKKWGVVMFFAEYDGMLKAPFASVQQPNRVTETLFIFGPRRARRGAQLTAMSAVEDNLHGYYSDATIRIGEMYEGQWCKDSDDADYGTTVLEIKDGLMPYATGKQGGTLTKLALASGAIVRYVGSVAYFCGSAEEQLRANEYLTWLLQQLDGPLEITDLHCRNDVTAVTVPACEVGFVTGSKRSCLGRMEEEWGVLMHFQGEHGKLRTASSPDAVPLLIFGESVRARKGAELDTMQSIEFKQKGYCSKHMEARTSDEEGFDVEYLPMTAIEVGFALGAGGVTRRKIASASGAILQFIGHVGVIAGDGIQRKRCHDYLEWVLQQAKRDREGPFIDTRGRDDVTEVDLSMDKAIGIVTGRNGSRLREIEAATGTLCLIARNHLSVERLCICSHDSGEESESGRKKAEQMFLDALHQAVLIQTGDARPERKNYRHNDGYSRRSSDWNGSRQGDRQGWNSWDSSRKGQGKSWNGGRGRGGARGRDERSRSRTNRASVWDAPAKVGRSSSSGSRSRSRVRRRKT